MSDQALSPPTGAPKPAASGNGSATKKDETKKQNGGGGRGGGGGQRRPSQTRQSQSSPAPNNNAGNAPSPKPTPSPRPGNRRPSTNAADSGSESGSRRDNNNRGSGRGGRGGGRGGRGGGTRSTSGTRPNQGRQNSGNKDAGPTNASSETSTPPLLTPAASEGSEALTSLQRVIADLKNTSTAPGQNNGQNSGSPAVNTQTLPSNLPPTAAPFQPGPNVMATLAGIDTAKHRKAASLGVAQSLSSNFGSYSPQFGGTIDEGDEGILEDGEIAQSQQFRQQTHQPRAQSQNFTAPRFAALAQQQQNEESVGPTGRPQLAPGFSFGSRRQVSSGPIAPAISEEDIGFQFPQQATPQTFEFNPAQIEQPLLRQENRGDVNGLMAEQIAIQNQIEALQQQQQALYHQQLASNQILSFQTPGLAPNRGAHRRVQSNVPGVGIGAGPMGSFATNAGVLGQLGQLGGMGSISLGQPMSGGHGRRHSVNVVNKPTHNSMASLSYGMGAFPDGFDDGFTAPGGAGGHSRQASRADSSWRINGGVGGVGGNANFASDLANAQAQLQSLQQFRAAAGGHHAKMPSFSFPNMLPNMMAANLMGHNPMSMLQQQQQQFQQQLQQQSNQPQRKSLFAPYLPQASLPPLLAAGKLVVGILRVNKRNRSDAYVATEVLDADIYICGSKDRNRALEGDIVAVELLDVDEVWSTKKEKEEKKRKKEENAAYEPKGSRKDDKKKDDVEVEGQGLMLFDDEEVTDEVKPQFAGHVVAVVERMPGQLFSGTLGLLRPSSAATKEKQEAERREREGDKGDEPRRAIERPKIVWFKPTDKRVPLIAIPTEQAPADFVQNSESYADKLFVACIKRHPISSLHPFGTLVEELGPIGDIEVETSALLKDCNFPTEEFTDSVMKCLPPVPWTIPETEFEARKDLRQERIFTIDPETAKDLDDALSIKANEDGTYDIGVHIADVSHFVKPNSPLDRDAKKRATSVYLVQRAVPMLPPTLSEEICSLQPGQERLTFSVIFTVTKDAKIVNKWFGKTVIKSAGKLSYENAQRVLDGHGLNGVSIAAEHQVADVAQDIKLLNEIATQLRDRRFKSGVLALESSQIKFTLDDTGRPTDCGTTDRRAANKLVEEFMLLANITTAQYVAVHLPEQAMLRRHDAPIERRLQGFINRAANSGHTMDGSSAGALMNSFDAITDPLTRRIIEMRFYKTTGRAKYFCSGMLDIAKYTHYALNVPLYTHFTSPIRRYADILVHRQLEAILAGGTDVKFPMDRDAVAKVAQQCNIKRDSAKLAQEQSTHLFLCVLIADLTQRYGPVIRPAKVVGVLDAAFDVLVPEFGIEKRVHIDQMPIDNHVYDERGSVLQIYWSDKDVISWLAENSDDEHLKKMKQAAEMHAQKMEVTTSQAQDESALFDEDEEEDKIVLGQEDPAQETSKQRLLSMQNTKPVFEGIKNTTAGHKIQEIKELMTVPVIITADLTKSPPVIKVYSVNPFAA